MNTRLVAIAAPFVAAVLGACSENTNGTLSLALTSRAAGAPVAASAPGNPAGAPVIINAGDSTVIALGNDTIIVRSVEIVLREIELKRVEAAGCDDIRGNDDCEEFETGATLVSLPLGATATATVVAVQAPPGLYDELEFEIHKPERPEDAAFLDANPTWAGRSIRVTGTYSQAGTRSDFTFTSDLNASQEVLISPALTVSEGTATNVTLRLDLAGWFLNEAGTALVDPATANKGQANEGVVKDNIEGSIDAFHDDDRDGHDDDGPNHT